MIDQLDKARFIPTLDLTRGYWQVPVADGDRHKIAFITLFGLYQFKKMPFGLQAAYLDDLVIYNSTWEEHIEHIHQIFQCLYKEAGLMVKPKKC